MIEELFRTRVKVKLLKFLVTNLEKSFTVTDISKFCSISKSRASEILREIEQSSIITSRIIGKSLLYSLNKDNKTTQGLILIFNQDSSSVNIILNEIQNLCQEKFQARLASIVLYGSYAKGTYRESSDINLLVTIDNLTNEEKEYISSKTNEISQTHNKKLNINAISSSQIEEEDHWPNTFFFDLLLSYKILYDKNSFFHNIMLNVSSIIKQHKPIFYERGKRWELIKLV